MALRLAIDVNRYADYCRGDIAAVNPVRRATEIYLPFITLAELRSGFRAGTRARENQQRMAEFIASPRVSILFPNEATTHFYAALFTELRAAGTPIPTNDLWIAALVIQHDLTLLTRDRHFELVPRLPRI